MSALHSLNPEAEHVRRGQALAVNIHAAKDMMDILKSGFGPSGTQKMLVSGSGDIKITKDGAVLLHEMRINVPTAALIARTATAQDAITGDGTTACILLIGEILEQAQRFVREGVHPRVLVDGLEKAREHLLEYMKATRVPLARAAEASGHDEDWALRQVARSSLCTKVRPELTAALTDIVVDAVKTIAFAEAAPSDFVSDADGAHAAPSIDLHMVEIMAMMHRSAMDTRLVKGLVLDHGARHGAMKKVMKNVHILTCNISFEYEKTEVNSVLMYQDAEARAGMVASERAFVTKRVEDVIAFKRRVCKAGEDFFIVNQKGIDPVSLELFAEAGITAVRRAKRRNMERVTRACGGFPVNSTDDLAEGCLGFAADVYERQLGENSYTFIEGVERPFSCTILIKGPNKHTLVQIKDAVRDGLRAVKNAMLDGHVLPGASAFELGAYRELARFRASVPGRLKLGVQVFAEALLIVPKTLARNSGFDSQETLIELQDRTAEGAVVGLDVKSGKPLDPMAEGIFDNYNVKHQLMYSSTVIASQLLLVDELLKAGRQLQSHDLQE